MAVKICCLQISTLEYRGISTCERREHTTRKQAKDG